MTTEDHISFCLITIYILKVSICDYVDVTFWCVQVLGKVPTISINKTDGCHVYLSKDSLECEIVSAKSSEMNVLVPGKDGDYVSTSMGEFGASSGII